MRTLGVLTTTAVLALAGCGGDEDKGTSGSTTSTTPARGYSDDVSVITETMTAYFDALADSDGEKACGFFTDDAKTEIEAAGTDCADAVLAGLEATGAEPFEDAKLGTPKVTGATATVPYRLTVKDQEVETTQALTKVGSDWKLEAATPQGG